jgi:hypothetical protein
MDEGKFAYTREAPFLARKKRKRAAEIQIGVPAQQSILRFWRELHPQ